MRYDCHLDARQGNGVELGRERREAFLRTKGQEWPLIWQNGIDSLSGYVSGGGRKRLKSMYPIMNRMSSKVIPNPCALCKAHYSNVLSHTSYMSSAHVPPMQ